MTAAMRSRILADVLDALLLGFQLSLYEQEEWERIWWISERLAARLESELGNLDAGAYVQSKILEAQTTRNMCLGSYLVSFVPAWRRDRV